MLQYVSQNSFIVSIILDKLWRKNNQSNFLFSNTCIVWKYNKHIKGAKSFILYSAGTVQPFIEGWTKWDMYANETISKQILNYSNGLSQKFQMLPFMCAGGFFPINVVGLLRWAEASVVFSYLAFKHCFMFFIGTLIPVWRAI